jgi:hypothetical protein
MPGILIVCDGFVIALRQSQNSHKYIWDAFVTVCF